MLRHSAPSSQELEHLYIVYDGQRSLPEEILCGAFKSISASPDKGLRGLLYYLSWNAASDRLGYDYDGEGCDLLLCGLLSRVRDVAPKNSFSFNVRYY